MADTISPTKNFTSTPALNVAGGTIGTADSPNVTDAIALGAVNQSEIYINYVQDTLTSLNVIVEVSQDKTTWFQKSLLNVAGGSASSGKWIIPTLVAQYQLTASQTLVIDLPIAHAYFRLRVWGIGTAGNDTAVIYIGGGCI